MFEENSAYVFPLDVVDCNEARSITLPVLTLCVPAQLAEVCMLSIVTFLQMIGSPPPEKQSRSVGRWKPGPRSEGVVLGLTKVEVLQVSRALALQLQGIRP